MKIESSINQETFESLRCRYFKIRYFLPFWKCRYLVKFECCCQNKLLWTKWARDDDWSIKSNDSAIWQVDSKSAFKVFAFKFEKKTFEWYITVFRKLWYLTCSILLIASLIWNFCWVIMTILSHYLKFICFAYYVYDIFSDIANLFRRRNTWKSYSLQICR